MPLASILASKGGHLFLPPNRKVKPVSSTGDALAAGLATLNLTTQIKMGLLWTTPGQTGEPSQSTLPMPQPLLPAVIQNWPHFCVEKKMGLEEC